MKVPTQPDVCYSECEENRGRFKEVDGKLVVRQKEDSWESKANPLKNDTTMEKCDKRQEAIQLHNADCLNALGQKMPWQPVEMWEKCMYSDNPRLLTAAVIVCTNDAKPAEAVQTDSLGCPDYIFQVRKFRVQLIWFWVSAGTRSRSHTLEMK